MFVNRSGRNEQSLYRNFHRCILHSFGSLGTALSEDNCFRNRPIRNMNCLWQSCLLTNRDEISNLYRGTSKNATYKILVHLSKRFQRRFFRNRPIRNQNYLLWPYLLTFLVEMSYHCRGPAIDASYQDLVHQTKLFQKWTFLEIDQSETRIACVSCLLANLDEISNLYRGPSKDATHKCWLIWESGFRGEDCLEIDQSETRIACDGHVC